MREANCPECGAAIRFESPGSLLTVCTFCSTASYRKDRDLESIGKVADRAPLASWFQVGTTGRRGADAFTVRGQLQLDHGLGIWNEWAAETDGGAWFWIAEAQGQVTLYTEQEAPTELPPRGELDPGRGVELGEAGFFTVVERGSGRVVTAAGELPVKPALGTDTEYVDLARGETWVATLDWTRETPELLVGQRVPVDALQLDQDTIPEHRPDRIKAREIACANCGAPIELQDAENARRVACGACSALLDPTSEKVAVLETEQRMKRVPALALGSRGKLMGLELRIIGFLVRSVMVDGTRYAWREYLLKVEGGGYRWLVESKGHWMFVEPLSPGALATGGFSLGMQTPVGLKSYAVIHRGETFRHFTSGRATVDFVLGEFYWDVQTGESAVTRDFTNPPHAISLEVSEHELHASYGTYVTRRAVARAFDHRRALVVPRGVAMAQPSPYAPLSSWWIFAGVAFILLLVVRVGIGLGLRDDQVLDADFGPVPRTARGNAGVELSEPFTLEADPGNLRIAVRVQGLANGWVGIDASLVNLETGAVTSFGVLVEQWSGVSGGERWSEGGQDASTWVGSVPAGRYRLRLTASGGKGGINRRYHVNARSQVPRDMWTFVAALILLSVPAVVSVLHLIFESRRWQESDHPWVQEG